MQITKGQVSRSSSISETGPFFDNGRKTNVICETENVSSTEGRKLVACERRVALLRCFQCRELGTCRVCYVIKGRNEQKCYYRQAGMERPSHQKQSVRVRAE